MNKIDYYCWLVKNRSANQAVSLKLYEISLRYENELKEHDEGPSIYLGLTSVAFSLWRAVFLADITEGGQDEAVFDDIFEHTTKFLENLIHHNAVGYQQDRGSRGFAFVYYMNSVRHRFRWLKAQPYGSQLMPDELDLDDGIGEFGAHEWWVKYHATFASAVEAFERMLAKNSN